MRAAALALLLAAPALAGCVGGDNGADGAPASGDRGADPTLGLTFIGCEAHMSTLLVSADEARSHLPPGFELSPAAEGPLALMGPGVFSCASIAIVGRERASAVQLAMAIILVQPPQALRRAEEGATHVLALGAYVSDTEAAEIFRAWGLPMAADGAASLDVAATGPNAWTARASGTIGADRFDVDGRVADPRDQPWELRPARIFSLSQEGDLVAVDALRADGRSWGPGPAATVSTSGSWWGFTLPPTGPAPFNEVQTWATIDWERVDVGSLR